MKQLCKKGGALCLAVALLLTLLAGCQGEAEQSTGETPQDTTQSATDTVPVNYSDSANWAYYAEGAGKDVDVFLICPTVDMGDDGNYNMSLEDTETKSAFVGALNMERGIYEDTATLYAPYYRQVTFPVYSMTAEEQEAYLDLAYQDVSDAFTYYMSEVNDGRPLILAGFSQGSQMLLRLLEDYFDEASYQDLLVAAYCIGWPVTEEDLNQYPHLQMAQGEDDTGVIISFNTDGEIETEVPQFTGAYLDPDRGTLRVTDVDPAAYSNSLFPDGVYHLYDYQFFYRNLQENVAVRTAAYLAAQ